MAETAKGNRGHTWPAKTALDGDSRQGRQSALKPD